MNIVGLKFVKALPGRRSLKRARARSRVALNTTKRLGQTHPSDLVAPIVRIGFYIRASWCSCFDQQQPAAARVFWNVSLAAPIQRWSANIKENLILSAQLLSILFPYFVHQERFLLSLSPRASGGFYRK